MTSEEIRTGLDQASSQVKLFLTKLNTNGIDQFGYFAGGDGTEKQGFKLGRWMRDMSSEESDAFAQFINQSNKQDMDKLRQRVMTMSQRQFHGKWWE